jgi:hypothetical protein
MFGVSLPSEVIDMSPGATGTVPLTGWSTEPVDDWDLYTNAAVVGGCAIATIVDVAPFSAKMNNGRTVDLSIQVPAGAASGSIGAVLVYLVRSDEDFHTVSILVRVR